LLEFPKNRSYLDRWEGKPATLFVPVFSQEGTQVKVEAWMKVFYLTEKNFTKRTLGPGPFRGKKKGVGLARVIIVDLGVWGITSSMKCSGKRKRRPRFRRASSKQVGNERSLTRQIFT